MVVHGHFYQPPREDPWLEVVRREASAAPWHDWNERIERECYRTVTAARIQDASGRIREIINTLEWVSFNVGPTLMEWMERHAPGTYRSFLEADRRSRERSGHGTAMAQPYHHTILPLASPRDRRTEIRWGIADFRRRFGREPEGMWLPETAVDLGTLDDLAAEGIAFTIVGDHQVEVPPPTGRPGWVRTGGGRRIAVFCYDGPLSHDIAFGPLLRDGAMWARRVLGDLPEPGGGDPRGERPERSAIRTGNPPRPGGGGSEEEVHRASTAREVVLMATDGETFGHHHPFGEMALAAMLGRLVLRTDVAVEPPAAVLRRFPPESELRLREPSAWSCAHGVERWRSDCGCRMTPGTQQKWRSPLRQGLDDLAAALHPVFEEGARRFGVSDPSGLRDALGPVVGADPAEWRAVVDGLLPPGLGEEEAVRLRELLEMERDLLRAFTSCGWFFDDIAGLEGLQVLRYAARALDLAGGRVAEVARDRLLEHLAAAPSNDSRLGTGADLFRRSVVPAHPPWLQVAAGAAALAVVAPHVAPDIGLPAWEAEILSLPPAEETTLPTARVAVKHLRTGRRWEAEVRVGSPDPGRVRIEARPLQGGGSPAEFSGEDLPEPQARAVASALRRRLVQRLLDRDERDRLLAGDATLAELAAERLLRRLQGLAGGGLEEIAGAMDELMALAELAGLAADHTPFDIQTALYRLREGLDPEARRALRPLARLLGFATSDDP